MARSLRPEPLQKGDTLGIMAPAGQIHDTNRFADGIRILREMGFEVRFPRDLWPGSAYLADGDRERAMELHELLTNADVKGIIALRGGYGCLRILDKIDLSLVSRHPKIIVGFSDISILQNFLYAQTGLVSLHGPVVTSLAAMTREALSSLFGCLAGHWSHLFDSVRFEILQRGRESTGALVGGNLASLVTLLGTSFDSSWDEKIVFLEDTNEPLYKVDRMLTQLKLAGKLDKAAGLLLGDFSTTALAGGLENLRYREAVWHRAIELFAEIGFPIWGNFPAGHCPANHTFPLGATAVMHASGGRLTITAS
ncbi:MAG: S66 peptidase family protein [Desulforhopalus sp.]